MKILVSGTNTMVVPNCNSFTCETKETGPGLCVQKGCFNCAYYCPSNTCPTVFPLGITPDKE